MKTTAVLLILAFTALTWAGVSKPAGTMEPAIYSDPTSDPPITSEITTATTTNTTTTTPKTTTTTAKTTTTIPKTTTTTAKTTTTTAKTTTTTAKTTTTTAKTTTTTAKTTTTPANTTTTTAKTTTTPANTTTTTPKTTTTVAPTPPPTIHPPAKTNSTVGNYSLKNGEKLCLMAQMELKIRLVSKEANGTFLLLPNKTSVAKSSTCNDAQAKLTLLFDEGNMTFQFSKNLTQKSSFVSMISFFLSYDFTKKIKSNVNAPGNYKADNQSVHLFDAQIGHSYSCRQQSLFMGNELYLDVSQDRMQAFNFTNSNDFGPSDPCPADKSNYRVAIAVGVTLLVLIVVVVVAYLLARRKRTDGYQSL